MPADFYSNERTLPTGVRIGIQNMIYTVALVVGIDAQGHYERRFCFPDWTSALEARNTWDGEGDPPGPWIKEKPSGRPNPNLRGIPIVAERGHALIEVAIIVAVACIAVVVVGITIQRQTTIVETESIHAVNRRNTPNLYRDPETGCEYLITWEGVITPRLRDGVPICGKQ